jgi:signal transduction histidine kinase
MGDNEFNAGLLSQLLEELSAGILVVNKACEIVYLNRTVSEMYCASAPSLHSNFNDWLASVEVRDANGKIVSIAEQPITRALKGEHPLPSHYQITPREGATTWVHVTVKAFSFVGLEGVVALFTNETRFVELRTNLLRAEEQLQRSQRLEAIGTLASGIVHDLGNVLETLLYEADLGESEAEASPASKLHFQNISKSVREGGKITRQLTQFSGSRKMEFKELSATTMVEDVLLLTASALQRAGIRLTTAFAESVPHVLADEGQIKQAILNLVLNARDAMPNGGELRISVDAGSAVPFGADGNSPFLRIAVADTGIGMEPSIAERVFEPFFTTKTVSGTGLGLASAYGIVKQHHGTITLETELGKGSVFSIFLPASQSITQKTLQVPKTAQAVAS